MSPRRSKSAAVRMRRSHMDLESLESRALFAVVSAGDLLVNVDATTGVTPGLVTSVPNTGTLGGVFAPTGGNEKYLPVIGRPSPDATSGTQGIRFEGNDFLQ